MAMAPLQATNADRPVSLLQEDEQFFHYLLSRDLSNLGDSGRIGYKSSEAAGSVPFLWEDQPGIPKSEFSGPLVPDLPPLSLPPSRQSAAPSSCSSASQSPKSIRGKVKSLIFSGKFSGPLVSNGSETFLHSSSSKSRRVKRSVVNSDGSAQRASFASSNSGAFPPKFFGKVEDDNSPTSTLDYNSDRYSASSSPLYYSPLYTSSSSCVSRNSAPLSPSASLAQNSSESVVCNVSSGTASANAVPSVPTNRLFSSSHSNAAPASQTGYAADLCRHSAEYPPKFIRDNPEFLADFIGCGALSKSLSTARVSFVDEQRALSTMFFSGPQGGGGRTVSFNPGMRDPTCSSLDKLFPLKSPNVFLPANRQDAPEMRRSSVDGHERFGAPCLHSVKVGKDDERTGVDMAAEDLIKLRDDGNAFADDYSPNLSRQPSYKRIEQAELKSILKKSRSTGGYSHELTSQESDLYCEQPRRLANSSSQKISSVLLRLAEAEEQLFNSRKQAADEASDGRVPACLSMCSFLGRAFLCRSRLTSSRNPH